MGNEIVNYCEFWFDDICTEPIIRDESSCVAEQLSADSKGIGINTDVTQLVDNDPEHPGCYGYVTFVLRIKDGKNIERVNVFDLSVGGGLLRRG